MASELEIRQKTIPQLLRDHREIFAGLAQDQLELLDELSDNLEENLKIQGAPLFAEEVIAGLTVLEMIDQAEIGLKSRVFLECVRSGAGWSYRYSDRTSSIS